MKRSSTLAGVLALALVLPLAACDLTGSPGYDTEFTAASCSPTVVGTVTAGWPREVTTAGTCQLDPTCDRLTETVRTAAANTTRTTTTCTVAGRTITTHDYHTGAGDRDHTT